jgi:AraC-like DNA-binding protein
MRTTERHARNDRIVQLRTRGLTLKEIAEEVGVSERHCNRILEERRQSNRSKTNGPTGGTDMPNATATELLDLLQETVGDFAARAGAAAGSDFGALLRLALMHRKAESSIDELRRRSEEFGAPIVTVPVDPGSKGPPPLRGGHVMTKRVRWPRAHPGKRYPSGTTIPSMIGSPK